MERILMKYLALAFMVLPVHMARGGCLTIADLRSMVSPGQTLEITDSIVVEGLITSDAGNKNLGDGVQNTYRANSSTMNDRTAYMESLDGKYGVKLVFQHYTPEARKVQQYAITRICLKGSTLRMSPAGALYAESIPNGSIKNITPGAATDVPVKVKTIAELSSEDFHTRVTVRDCEYVFKDGAYVNILENYARENPTNKMYHPHSFMDTWQSLLCDKTAAPLYVVINSRVAWRRTGNGVPQGTGSISGILVESDNLRYGPVHAWQIRPLEESDIDFEWKGKSSFTTIAEWNWNDAVTTFNTTDGPVERFRYEKMLPDVGKGELTLDFLSSTYRGMDMNNPVLEPTKDQVHGHQGRYKLGAMEIRTQVPNWWNWGEDCGNAVVLKFSTAALKQGNLFLAFSFSAGRNDKDCSRFAPVYWGVEVSTDNVHISRVNVPDIVLRTLPWWENVQDGVTYVTSWEAGLGMTEHLVRLPSSLLGQQTVYVRICPVKKNLMNYAMEGSDKSALRQNMTYWSNLSFGAITIRYREDEGN